MSLVKTLLQYKSTALSLFFLLFFFLTEFLCFTLSSRALPPVVPGSRGANRRRCQSKTTDGSRLTTVSADTRKDTSLMYDPVFRPRMTKCALPRNKRKKEPRN